jgi:hypothetical protein
MLIQLIVGIELQVSEEADKSTARAASTLLNALTAEGITAVLKTVPAQEVPNPAVINVTVGKNPASMQPIEPQP